jgi:hypothetical protein
MLAGMRPENPAHVSPGPGCSLKERWRRAFPISRPFGILLAALLLPGGLLLLAWALYRRFTRADAAASNPRRKRPFLP